MQVIFRNILFIVLLLTLFGGVASCSLKQDYVVAEEPRLEEGWVNDDTFQLIVNTKWDNEKYYLSRYERSYGRTAIRFSYLKRIYTKYFRKRIISDVGTKLTKLAYLANPEISLLDWEGIVQKALSQTKDLNIILVKEVYSKNGLIEYTFQIKKPDFKSFIDCSLAGGAVC